MEPHASAVTGIRSILCESWHTQGFQVPDHVTQYIVRILADKLDKNPWQPQPSYAEQFMMLRTPAQALELGNTCFFTRSVFPDLGRRRGISSSYYVDIGQACYHRVLTWSAVPAVQMLHDHFEWCAEMTHTAVHSQGAMRQFWDLE